MAGHENFMRALIVSRLMATPSFPGSTIENAEGQLSLRAGHRGETYVNGEVVSSRVLLRHGDRLVIGGNHFFRVSVPAECTATDTAEPVDFEFAQCEISRLQVCDCACCLRVVLFGSSVQYRLLRCMCVSFQFKTGASALCNTIIM